MLDQLRLILKALPWTGPAVVVGALLAMLTMMVFPRRRTLSDRVGFALLVWCLVVAGVVTLSPVKNSYFGVPSSGCDWSVWTPLARQYWFSAGSRPPNVWLLFPAGLGVMLLDGFWRRFVGVAMLFALPPAVETIQDLYPQLKRSCSSQDVADNWTGLVMGLLVGTVLALVIAVVRAVRRRVRARTARRERALGASTAGPYAVAGEPTQAADDDLPLSGAQSPVTPYDEFADFDDTPNSTRWYDEGSTRAMPTTTAPSRDDDAAPASRRDDGPVDSDTTRVIARRGRHLPGDVDATQIMPRR